jgi:SPP1 gp7 family putative phage head morphogenesis protein
MLSPLHAALQSASPLAAAQMFQSKMGDRLAEYLAMFDLLGRLHVMEAARQRAGIDARLATTSSFDDVTAGGTLPGLENVPFVGAIRRLFNLTGYTRRAFDGLAQRYKMTAFTMSGISDVALIEKIKETLAQTVADGGTADDFRAAINQLVSDAGVAEISRQQANTIFQTNVQRAYQNGRFEQMKDPAVMAALPYWQYATAGDSRVRPAHAALDGFTALNDDPVWRRIYPPCGFNCRCTVIAVSEEDAPDDASTPGLTRIPPEAASVPDPGFGGSSFMEAA